MISMKFGHSATAVMAAMTLAISAVDAQDANSPGIVRVSDGKSRVVAQPASFHGHSRGHGDGTVCDHCQQGTYDQGNPLFRERYCKNSPDYGYAPPAKVPLHRRGIQYSNYYPNQWYGLPGSGLAGGYPMVYQATDTTQLGYYYQHVPSWQPNPNMLPRRPIPAQWHIGAPAVLGSDYHHLNNQSGNGHCPAQQHGVIQQDNGVIQQTPIENAPLPTPSPAANVPPSPREIQNAAESEHIRRAGF
jgi:hypothetical protein